MTATKLIAFRDPFGFRPLCLGKTKDGAYTVASESCALDSIGADFIRDINPGEIVTINIDGVKTNRRKRGSHACILSPVQIPVLFRNRR